MNKPNGQAFFIQLPFHPPLLDPLKSKLRSGLASKGTHNLLFVCWDTILFVFVSLDTFHMFWRLVRKLDDNFITEPSVNLFK
jgi:hypothetical protein